MEPDALYPYQLEDFHQVSVLQLRVGDELLLSGLYRSDRFATLPVISLTFPEGDWMVYSYCLPLGLDIASDNETTVYVKWKGSIPCITVDVWKPITHCLYILRKEG